MLSVHVLYNEVLEISREDADIMQYVTIELFACYTLV